MWISEPRVAAVSQFLQQNPHGGKQITLSNHGAWPSCMETGFRSSCVAYSRPCRVISSESFTPSSRHLPWRWQRLPLLTSPPLMPFSIDHYPASPSPLLARAQSENASCSCTLPTHLPGTVPPPRAAVAHGRRWGFDRRLWLFALIWSVRPMCRPELLANSSLPGTTIPRRPKAIVTQPRRGSHRVWATAEMFAVNEAL